MMCKAVYAASGCCSSFKQASENLQSLAEVSVSAKRLQRLVTRIGNERMQELEQQAADYQALSLADQNRSPLDSSPGRVCIQCDGGRLQVRDRVRKSDVGVDADQGSESHEVEDREVVDKSTFWRESKVGSLLSFEGQEHESDPCPEIPSIFVDPARIRRLTREIKGYSGDGKGPGSGEKDGSVSVDEPQRISDLNSLHDRDNSHAATRPKPILRNVIATSQNIHHFAQLLRGEAWRLGFFGAAVKVFLCDGMSCNWKLHEKYFSRFTAILDFVHAICYVYHAAIGDQPSEPSWSRYCQWAQWLWSGEIETLLEAMKELQSEIGWPLETDSETSHQSRLATAIGYITNNQSRMDYARYRQLGLPISSVYVESTIKQINQRVKGTEKFWSTNTDPILQLRADAISEGDSMQAFWKRRSKKLSPRSQYKMAN